MGEFSSIGEKADKKIREDLRLICEEIKKEHHIKSIILGGGFSRGEGPVKLVNGKLIPFNDYDIYVISEEKVSKEEVDELSNRISNKLGYKGIQNFYPFKKEEQKMQNNFYIDLKWVSPQELKKLFPRIRNYELRNFSKILYGEDIRGTIPNYSIEEIPLSEGAKLLLDRMSQMVEYYSTDGKYDKEFLTYIIQQAYAACCTSLLMFSRKYQIGYKKAMKIFKETYKGDFPELYGKIQGLDKKIEQFIEWKLNPEKIPKNIEQEWFIAKKSIIEVSKYFFSKFLKKDIKNLDELSMGIIGMRERFYAPYIKSQLKNSLGINFGKLNLVFLPFTSLVFKYRYYLRLKKIGIKKPGILFSKSPELLIFGALPYLIGSIGEKGIDSELLKKGQEILKEIYPSKGKNWEEISLDYANAYIAFFLQKL